MHTAFKQRFDLVVVAQERNKKVAWTVLKNKTQGKAAATLEKLVAQFANAKTAVDMRPTETFNQSAQGQQTFGFFALGQPLEPPEDARVD